MKVIAIARRDANCPEFNGSIVMGGGVLFAGAPGNAGDEILRRLDERQGTTYWSNRRLAIVEQEPLQLGQLDFVILSPEAVLDAAQRMDPAYAESLQASWPWLFGEG